MLKGPEAPSLPKECGGALLSPDPEMEGAPLSRGAPTVEGVCSRKHRPLAVDREAFPAQQPKLPQCLKAQDHWKGPPQVWSTQGTQRTVGPQLLGLEACALGTSRPRSLEPEPLPQESTVLAPATVLPRFQPALSLSVPSGESRPLRPTLEVRVTGCIQVTLPTSATTSPRRPYRYLPQPPAFWCQQPRCHSLHGNGEKSLGPQAWECLLSRARPGYPRGPRSLLGNLATPSPSSTLTANLKHQDLSSSWPPTRMSESSSPCATPHPTLLRWPSRLPLDYSWKEQVGAWNVTSQDAFPPSPALQ